MLTSPTLDKLCDLNLLGMSRAYQERESAKSAQHHGPGGRFRDGGERPEEPTRLPVDAVGEEEGVRVSITPSAAENYGPKTARRVAGARVDLD